MINGDDLIEQVATYAGEPYRAILQDALALAQRAHDGIYCEPDRPYLDHVLAVSYLLAEWHAPIEIILAGILHDLPNRHYSTLTSLGPIRECFGEVVANHVDAVAQLSRVGPPQSFEESDDLIYGLDVEATRLPWVVRVLSRDPMAAAIKVADRIEKLTNACALAAEQRQAYALSTMGIFVPIANRLGMWQAKRALEDKVFQLLHGEAYAQVAERYALEKRQAAAGDIISQATAKLQQDGVLAEVTLLPVSLYSLHRALIKEGKPTPFHFIQPILALVESVEACYMTMHSLHELWPPSTGQVWDYIAAPKSNQYRGIHTRLRLGPGEILTVIIRTREMHKVAERGITAGWWGVPENLLPKPPEWREPPAGWIPVFTPNGDLFELPEGACAIDFAYAIHPQVGHQCVGATVNGDPTPLEKALQPGDVIEITTSETALGPSEDWLRRVKSRKAVREIKRWLASQSQDGLAQKGWDLIDARLRETGTTLASAETAARLKAVAGELGYGTTRELQTAVALGRRTSSVIVARMQKLALHGGVEIAQATIVPLVFSHLPRRLARCCRPLAPDAIVGYVTKHDEVVIHRATCRNSRRLKPLLAVEWSSMPWQDTAQIVISADDRLGLVRDIAAAVTDTGISMSQFHADRAEDGSARVTLSLEQRTVQQTTVLLERLRSVPDVRNIVWGAAAPGAHVSAANYFRSPYTLSPVTGKRFFGRDLEFRKLSDYLCDPVPGKAILLWGPRRIGKTSLLHQFVQLVADTDYLPVFLDMQSISGQDTAVFLHAVAKRLATAINSQNVNVPKFNRMRRDPLNYFRSFVEQVRQVERRHIILILDEFQVLTGLKQEVASLADSFSYLRSLITGGSDISFLFSGGGVLDKLQRQVGASSLLNVTHHQKVECLKPDEARKLIVEPVQNLQYDDEVVERLLDLTGGHPYYLQMLCGELAHSAYHTDGTCVRMSHLQTALADWLPDREEHHFSHLWGTDSDISYRVQQYNKLFLAALPAAEPVAERWVTFDAISSMLESSFVNEQALWQGLQDLTQMDTLDFDGDSKYRIKVSMCQDWIRSNYTVARILKEIGS
jgi:GTP diphosphokinase / guanosine-3',5'-bis(diphosphate) 3'-diphosphatase